MNYVLSSRRLLSKQCLLSEILRRNASGKPAIRLAKSSSEVYDREGKYVCLPCMRYNF